VRGLPSPSRDCSTDSTDSLSSRVPATASTRWSRNVGIAARTGWPSVCPSSSGSGKRSRKSSISKARAPLKMRPSMSAIAIFRGNCRGTGDLGIVAALAMTICSLSEPVLRMNVLSARGAAVETTLALVGFLLRAVIESRSRSSTGLPERVASERFRNETRPLLVPPSHAHEFARGLRPLVGDGELRLRLGAAGRTRTEAGFEHRAMSLLISPLSAPESMIFAYVWVRVCEASSA
jgi:hypothetical protein